MKMKERATKRRNQKELIAEEKSFNEIYQKLLELQPGLQPGTLAEGAEALLREIKAMIREKKRYYHMDMIAGYSRDCTIDYIITDMVDRIEMSQVFLKLVEPKETINVSQEECEALVDLIRRMGRERAIYMRNARKLRQLAQIMDMLTL